MKEHLIYGIIGFFIGGMVGIYFAGRTCAREYKKRIDELTEQNRELSAKRYEETEKEFEQREEAVKKKEHKVNKTLKALRANRKADTRTFEALSKEYKSDAFDSHFADRAAPEDDEPEDYEIDDIEDDAAETQEPIDRISLISSEQFKKDLPVRDSANYTFYQEDGVLVDDITQEVERDQAGILGEEAMGLVSDTEEDYLYIDNENDDMLYEISVEHSLSYYRDVLGL